MMYRLRTCYAAAPCTCVLYLNEYFLQWYRTHLNSNPSMNGNLPYNSTLQLQVASPLLHGVPQPSIPCPPGHPPGPCGPPGLPTGPPTPPGPPDPTGLPLPMPMRPVPVRPVVYQQRFPMPPPNYNVPPMQSLLPQGVQAEMLRIANQDSARTETCQPSNVAPRVQSQPLLQAGLLPERPHYPRNVGPLEEAYKKYLAHFQPGYQELPGAFDHAHYIDGLPAEPRNDCRVNPNYAIMNGGHREQTWAPVIESVFDGSSKVRQPFLSETEDKFASVSTDKRLIAVPCNRADDKELEEELEALARRIDTEFKNAD